MDKKARTSIDSIYQDVPRKYVDELFTFRSTHPIRRRVIDGVEWNYILCEQGSATVLVLGGAMSTAETSRSLIGSLEEEYRVLAPGYPIYEQMGQFVDGLVRLLDLEGIPRVHVYGHSLGAGIGHVLIRRHADRVGKLILSSFGLYNERNLRQAKRFLRLFRLLPYGFVSGYYKRRMPKLLTGIDEEEKVFLAAYMKDVLDLQLNKAMLVSQFRILEDMFENTEAYGVYQPVKGKAVLILQAKDDTGFEPGEQTALRQTYPHASVHLFEEGGHLTRTAHRSEYDAILHEFLETHPH
jgi:pimeloyl-ACP methyl ester carboxylesterase